VQGEQSKHINFSVKDHSVSGEIFELVKNETLGYLETKPQPSIEKLPDYYKSEDYISHTDSKRNLFEKAYHFVKKIALKRKLNLINSYSDKKGRLLDVGCGTGDFLEFSKQNGWSILGIEPNDEARLIANKKTNNSVYKSDHLLNLQHNSFDIITLWHVLEHLPNLDEHIAVFRRLLKRNGTLIIAVPNYRSYDAKFYKTYWAAFDVPRHLWHFSKSSIKNLMAEANMNVVKTYPMQFDAFYVSLLSEKYKTGRMKIVRPFFIGLISNLKGIWTKEYSSIIYCVKKGE
jgi:2-polyprenyl-3-methyl-5-hydroxy-6-metoxy-1,4-benzoquinol methylase